MYLKIIKPFSSLRRPEPHFSHEQDHQRACALTVSINIFQSTITTVYEIEYQKTFKTKLGRHFLWFSQVIEEFNHYFQEN